MQDGMLELEGFMVAVQPMDYTSFLFCHIILRM